MARRFIHVRAAILAVFVLLACIASLLAASCAAAADPETTVDAAYIEEGTVGEDFALVDVRTAAEFGEGHIPGALNIPYVPADQGGPDAMTMAERFEEKGIGEDDPVVLYCRTGRRAASAADELVEAGYANIKVYVGSWTDWTSDPNRPTE